MRGEPGLCFQCLRSFCLYRIGERPLHATLTLASQSPNGSPGDFASSSPSLSADGSSVAFQTLADNLGPTMLGNSISQIVIENICSFGLRFAPPCYANLSIVSENDGSLAGTGPSTTPSVSSNGRYVAFASTAPNFPGATGVPANSQVFVRDTCGGSNAPTSGCTASITLFSVSQAGNFGANGSSSQPSISDDGSIVAFASTASDLVPAYGDGQHRQVFVRGPLCFGTRCTINTIAVNSVPAAPTPVTQGSSPSLSSDGGLVAYQETNTGSNSAVADVRVASTCVPVPNICVYTSTNTWVSNVASTPSPKSWITGPIAGPSFATPSISGDGHVVTYSSPGAPIGIVFSLTGF